MSQSPLVESKRFRSIPNPFLRDVVGSPFDDARVDVPQIHHHAFERCLKLVSQVRDTRESGSLLLFGEPGSGKTHLLSRLRQHLDRENEAGRTNLFIPLRMQTSPGMVWRFLRRNLADALLRRKPGEPSTLQRILECRRPQLDAMIHRDMAIVLENIARGVHVRDSSAWLRDQELPDAALMALGLSSIPVDEEYQEERAYDAVKEIAELAQPIPFVFCLDQVEALQRHIEDREGIFALGKMVAALHDTLHNAAIICCVQTSFIDAIKTAIRASEQDRLLTNRAGLQPLTWDQANQLIAARLDTQPELRDLRPREAANVWPLDAAKLRPIFEPDGASVARKVLHRAREVYDELSVGVAVLPEPLDAFLSRLFEDRTRSRPPQESDFILRYALPQLLQIVGIQPKSGDGFSTHTFDLVIEHEGRPAAFALCNQRPGIGLVNRFRKLGEKWNHGFTPRLVLLRDARLGIGGFAKASQQRLEELRSRHAEFINVSPEALAALDAIRSLLIDADSGDLSHNGEKVTRDSVERWLLSHLPAALEDFVEQLKGQARASSFILPALAALLNERKVASMEDIARELKTDLREVADCANQNPDQFAVLEGPRPVLFQPVRRALAS